MKIAKYLSPPDLQEHFLRQRDVAIVTERKKLTIFFSDIKDSPPPPSGCSRRTSPRC